MKKIAVILSGSGVYDGAEIQEAVLTLLAIDQCGASYRCFAPNIEQYHVINHLTGAVSENETRNVLVESARIARGDIEDLTECHVDEWDALIVPGGFGAAKNLSTFGLKGSDCEVNDQVLAVCKAFAQANKPAGYMCIAPAMLPLIYSKGVKGTIGNDAATAESIETMGLTHVVADVESVVIDENNNVITTPAYMLATSVNDAFKGISRLVKTVIARS